MSNKSKDKNNKISEIDDHIRRSFDIKKHLGKGAYGIVWKAIDKRTQQIVAVKKIFDAFRNVTDAQRTYREVMFLRAFRNHPNIIQLYSIHRATNHMDLYLSFEFMESDLHNVIKRGSILRDIHKRYVMYQLLNATNFIHSGNVIHRDMKPSNVLVDSKCRCKLADFGLARSLSQNHQSNDRCSSVGDFEPCLTDYVATRWYRAPEILIANKNYTKGIDMWSLGCILGEMCRGKPLFPGSCTINQVECILSALPEPTETDIKSVGNGFGSVLLNQSTKSSSSNPSMDELLADSPTDAKHLIKSLLVLDPTKRLTAKQAMCHRYVEKFRDTSPELELTADIVPPFRDDIQLTVAEYRSKLYEIMSTSEKKSALEKKSSVSSPPIIQTDSSPTNIASITENGKKSLANLSNTRPILPKAVATPTQPDRKVSSSVKCQNDVKPNLSYSNVFQPKSMLANTKTTSIQQQQKNLNGSYARLTNKLNCCRSCVRDADDASVTNTKKHSANIISMPKLKNDVKYTAKVADSNANYRFETDSKYKLPTDAKRSIISATFRRNSMDGNTVLRKSTFQRSIDEEDLQNSYFRRQSLDDLKVKDGANQKTLKKIPSPLNSLNDSDFYRNGHSNGQQMMASLNNNKNLNRQMSVDKYTDATTRLRNLEMKMRKHKIDVLKYVNEHEQHNHKQNGQKSLAYDNHFRSKLDSVMATKSEYAYPKISIDNVLNNNNNNRKTIRKSASVGNGNGYGIISAADLFKLRATPERVT